MAQSFAGIAILGYQGIVFRLPVKLPQGVAVPPNQVPPSVCPVKIDWNIYWQLASNPANVGVSVNLQAQSVQANILDRIASVKIDNTNSPNSVFVLFPDTMDLVTCPPYSLVTMPVLTNLLNANIFVEGLTAGNIPQTNVFFYNVVFPPSVDAQINQAIALWKASPTITRGTTIYNQNYGTPALGDTAGTAVMTLTAPNSVTLFGSPAASGFYYLTNLYIDVFGVTNPSEQGQTLFIESTGISGLLYQFGFIATDGQPTFLTIAAYENMQLKLDATQLWRARTQLSLTGGTANINYNYTFSET